MKINRIAVFILIVIIVFVATFGFAVGIVSVPTIYAYASDQEETNSAPPGYTQVSSNNQLGEGFLAYCKSRDSEITSSVVGATVTSAYDSLAKFCRYVGFNIADLQSHLWYLNQPGQPTKWFFDSTGINIYNRAFAYLIQEHELEVGDQADDISIYDGEYFTTDDGSTCLVYSANVNGSSNIKLGGNITDLNIGSKLKYSGDDIIGTMSVGDIFNISVTINGLVYQGTNVDGNGLSVNKFHKAAMFNGVADDVLSASFNSYSYVQYSKLNNIYGEFCIFHTLGNDRYYIGFIGLNNGNSSYINGPGKYFIYGYPITISNDNKQNVNVIFTTNNTVINNNVYEGDTIINDYGDVINEPDNPDQPDPGDPTIPYNPYPDNPNYDPVNPMGPGGTTTDPHNTGGGSGEDDTDVTFPDFDFQLPQINWSIGDLSEKFPFSIPFDLVAFFTVMNAEPQAPAIDAEIPLGDWYTWNFQADFSQFDRYAAIIRNVEFIAFCIGLIYLTIRLVRG